MPLTYLSSIHAAFFEAYLKVHAPSYCVLGRSSSASRAPGWINCQNSPELMSCDPLLALKNKHILYLPAVVFLKLHGIWGSRGCWVMSLGCPRSPLELSPSAAVLRGAFSLCLSIVNLISVFLLLPMVSHQQEEERRKKTATPPHIHPHEFNSWARSCVKKKWQAAILRLKIFVKLSCNSFGERGRLLNRNTVRQPNKGNRMLLVRKIQTIKMKTIWADNLMADHPMFHLDFRLNLILSWNEALGDSRGCTTPHFWWGEGGEGLYFGLASKGTFSPMLIQSFSSPECTWSLE